MATVMRRINPGAVRPAEPQPAAPQRPAQRAMPGPARPVQRPQGNGHAPQRPPAMTEERGTVTTTVRATHRREAYYETDAEDTLLTQQFSEENPPAWVEASVGITKKMGLDFEFLRIDARVKIPVDRSRVDEGWEYALTKAVEKVQEEEVHWLGVASERQGGR